MTATTWFNIPAQIDAILSQQRAILAQGVKLMSAMTDLQASVAAENTVIASAITLLKGLKAALDAAGTDPAALAALKADIDAQTQGLADAITANTPAA
jgi:predicted  nucleic acid-binding Zn-ribbon protein